VARVAEVSGAEAKPKGDGAAVAALEVNEVSTVDLAVSHALAFNCTALCAEKLIFFELDRLLLASYAVHHPAKIRFFALKTSEVGHLKQGELF
jgi:hypothetical protein